MAEYVRLAILEDEHLSMMDYVLCGRPLTKVDAFKELQPKWSFRDDTAISDEITMIGRKDYSTCINTKQSTELATLKLHRHRKKKITTGIVNQSMGLT